MNKYIINALVACIFTTNLFCETITETIEIKEKSEGPTTILDKDKNNHNTKQSNLKIEEKIMNKEEKEFLKTFGYLMASNAGLPSLSLSEDQLNVWFEGVKAAVNFEKHTDNYKENINKIGDFLADLEAKAIEKNKLEEQKFLSEKDKEKDVIKTKSGLRYKVIKPTTEKKETPKITVDSNVKVAYTGQLLNGFVFDESEDVSFYLGSLIAGFQEAIQLMKVGETIEAYIPSVLGYKNQNLGSIPPASCLTFTITLKEVINKK